MLNLHLIIKQRTCMQYTHQGSRSQCRGTPGKTGRYPRRLRESAPLCFWLLHIYRWTWLPLRHSAPQEPPGVLAGRSLWHRHGLQRRVREVSNCCFHTVSKVELPAHCCVVCWCFHQQQGFIWLSVKVIFGTFHVSVTVICEFPQCGIHRVSPSHVAACIMKTVNSIVWLDNQLSWQLVSIKSTSNII